MGQIGICRDCKEKKPFYRNELCSPCYWHQFTHEHPRRLLLERRQARNQTYRNKKWLDERYCKQRLNAPSIAREAGVTTTTIYNWLKYHGIARRTSGESQLGKPASNWKGGRSKSASGYIRIWAPDNIMASKQGYVMEHRLVVSKNLGRPLEAWEIVHHKNGIKDDNRIENLELLPKQADHTARERMKAENLKWQRAFYRAVGLWLGERRKRLERITLLPIY